MSVSSHFHSVADNFSQQFRNDEFLDCTLNAEGRSIKVHKAVLCAQSALLEVSAIPQILLRRYFSALNDSFLLQKMILDHKHVADLFFTIDGVLFEDLKSVVQFMYDGCAKLSGKNFRTFLIAAQLLGMKWVDYIRTLVDDDQLPMLKPRAETEVISITECRVQPLVLRNIANIPKTKRKKCSKAKKHTKKLKSARLERKMTLQERPSAPTPVVEEMETLPETDLAKMDENTFYAALGLRKVADVVRDSAAAKSIDGHAKSVATSATKISLTGEEMPDNIAGCEVDGSVYIAEKNLILNAGANEMRIRENDIEIECDVLDATNQLVVYDKENAVGEIIELREGKYRLYNSFNRFCFALG